MTGEELLRGLRTLRDIVSLPEVETLARMLAWARAEKRYGVVPTFTITACMDGSVAIDAWLHPEHRHQDDRIPPHGHGSAPTLAEAWVQAMEDLTATLYRYDQTPPPVSVSEAQS